MAGIKELIRAEENGSISFGNDTLSEKTKRSNFIHNGDSYKVKTYKELTKLECNEMFVYESIPGTVVTEFVKTEEKVSFFVEGLEDAEITLELEEETEYEITINGDSVGVMQTNLSGKLSLGVELQENTVVSVCIEKK